MKKKIFAWLLVLTLFVVQLAGCGSSSGQTGGNSQSSSNQQTSNQQDNSQQSDQAEASAETSGASQYQTTYGSKVFDNVTISVELFDRSNAPDGSTITKNKWTDYVNQEMNKVGINVEFVPVPRWDEVTKMQTMMASGTAPDLTVTYTYSYAEEYLAQGGIWDLSEFIDGDDQALNLKSYVGDDVLKIGRNTDDNLFGIVAKRATTAQSNLFIRKDWLDALGLGIPTTTDELYNSIQQMVTNNPDGRTDVIGAIFWNSWNSRMPFSKLTESHKDLEIAGSEGGLGEGAIREYYDTGMRDFFKFQNKLYNEGLMHKEYYTLSEDTFKSYIVTGSLAFFEYSVNGAVDVMRGSLLKTLQENNPNAEIVSIPALKNVNDGKQYSGAYAPGGLIAFCPLTASAEKVEAAMTYLDWLSTKDGGFVLYHGFEGEHFEYDGEVPIVKDATYNSQDKDWLRADIFLVGNQGYFATVDEFNACTSKESPGYEDYVIANYENALSGTVVYSPYYTSPSTPNLTTDINLIRDEYIVKCITSPEADFDKIYDDYIHELEGANIQTIIDERTAHFTDVYGY